MSISARNLAVSIGDDLPLAILACTLEGVSDIGSHEREIYNVFADSYRTPTAGHIDELQSKRP